MCIQKRSLKHVQHFRHVSPGTTLPQNEAMTLIKNSKQNNPDADQEGITECQMFQGVHVKPNTALKYGLRGYIVLKFI